MITKQTIQTLLPQATIKQFGSKQLFSATGYCFKLNIVELIISYQTVIAVRHAGYANFNVTAEYFSSTTTRHKNIIKKQYSCNTVAMLLHNPKDYLA